ANAVNRGGLDESMTGVDKEKLLVFLRGVGGLRPDHTYRGSPRAGFDVPPAAAMEFGKLSTPLSMQALTQTPFWQFTTNFAEGFTQAATMLQPVGGMDRIAAAFAQRLGDAIVYNTEVIRVSRAGE